MTQPTIGGIVTGGPPVNAWTHQTAPNLMLAAAAGAGVYMATRRPMYAAIAAVAAYQLAEWQVRQSVLNGTYQGG